MAQKMYSEEPPLSGIVVGSDIFCLERSPLGAGAPFQYATMEQIATFVNTVSGSAGAPNWNASTNSPTLASSTAAASLIYLVSVAGTTSLNDIDTWEVGDYVYFTGGVWERLEMTEAARAQRMSNKTVTNSLLLSNVYYADVTDPTKKVQFDLSAMAAADEFTFAFTGEVIGTLPSSGNFNFASTQLSETFTNKSISGATNTLSAIGNSSLTNSSITINGVSVSLGGSTTVTASTTAALTVSTGLLLNSGTTFDGGTAKTITIDSTVVTLAGSQTLTNKTLTGNIATNLVSGAATITLPTTTGTLATLAGTETLTNKTLTGNTATNLVSGAATITLPTVTGTLATLAGTETLSNKSIVSDSLLLTLASEPTNTVNFDLTSLANTNIDFTLSFDANTGGNEANFLEGNYDVVGDILPQSIAYKDIGLSTIGTSSLASATTYFRDTFSDSTRLFFDLGLMPTSAVANIQMLGTSTVSFEAGTYTVASIASPQTLTNKNIVPRGTTLTSGTGTLTENYDVLLINKSVASATTVLCPASAPALPAFYVIKDAKGDAATNNITIFPTATYTIDGASSFVMNANYQSVKLYWSGTNYYIL